MIQFSHAFFFFFGDVGGESLFSRARNFPLDGKLTFSLLTAGGGGGCCDACGIDCIYRFRNQPRWVPMLSEYHSGFCSVVWVFRMGIIARRMIDIIVEYDISECDALCNQGQGYLLYQKL